MIKYPVIGLTSRRPTVSQEKTEKAQIIWLAWTGKHRSLVTCSKTQNKVHGFLRAKQWTISETVHSDHSDSAVSKKKKRDWTLRRLQWHSSMFWKYNVVTNLLIYCDGTVLASDLWGHRTCDVAHTLLSRNAPIPLKHREEASVSPLCDTKCEVHSLVQGHTVASAGQRQSELSCLPFVCLGNLSSGLVHISPSMIWKDPSTFPYVCYLMYTWHNKTKRLWEIC